MITLLYIKWPPRRKRRHKTLSSCWPIRTLAFWGRRKLRVASDATGRRDSLLADRL